MTLNLNYLTISGFGLGNFNAAGGSRTSTSLNAAYVHNTSGPAWSVRYQCMSASTIDELYIFMGAVTGTLGNVSMQCDIYNENTLLKAGTTLRDSSTACTMASAANKWIKFTFGSPYTPAIGEVLWLVAYNTASAPATDFPQILTNTTCQINGTATIGYGYARPVTTTNGFTGNGTEVPRSPFVIKQGSSYFGNPFTQNNTTYYASNTRRRGIEFTPDEDIGVNGLGWNTNTINIANFQLYDGSTAPGGSTLLDYSLDAIANEVSDELIGSKIFANYTLTGGSKYRAVVTFGAASTQPSAHHIEDYSTYSSVFDTLRVDGAFSPYSVIDDGAGGWTVDKAVSPNFVLFINQLPAQAAGGGGLPVSGPKVR